MTEHLIFEETVSALYYSNDGRIYVEKAPHPVGREIAKTPSVWLVKQAAESGNDEVIFATYDRVKVDAYIAGYDEAERLGREKLAAALNAWGEQLAAEKRHERNEEALTKLIGPPGSRTRLQVDIEGLVEGIEEDLMDSELSDSKGRPEQTHP